MALTGGKKKKAPATKGGAKRKGKAESQPKAEADASPAPYPGVTNGHHANEVREMRDDFIRWAKDFSMRQELTPREHAAMMQQLGDDLAEVLPK